ncbi:MAG: hypothetical protein AAGU75_02470 [Bacillota bacterium]
MEEKQIAANPDGTQEPWDFTFDMGGLQLAFWGLLFTVINIRIQGFDIVPDIIGYIMIIIGLGRIEKYEEKFNSAKKISYVLAVMALVSIYQAPIQSTVNQDGMMGTAASSVNFSAGIFGSNALLGTLMMIAGLAANIYFTYTMCMGMKTLLEQVGDAALAGICEDRWKLVLAAQIGLVVSIAFAMLQIPFGSIMTILFAALALIAMVLFLLLVHHAYQNIHGKRRIVL